MKIKNVELIGNTMLAPMAGVTDIGFRKIAKRYGASLTTTEMVSARALVFGSKNTYNLLEKDNSEMPCAVQLFGHIPEDFSKAINDKALEKFDIIDINMGCPAPKIVKNGDGSALLKNPLLVEKIISTCVQNTDKPITVKMRKSFVEDGFEALEIAKICEESGASAITIHGRTRPQMYSGQVDLDAIAKIKSVVKIPVIGNGDIVDEKSLNAMLETKVDGVAIGRASLGKPWIFGSLNNDICVDKLKIILEHIDTLLKYYSKNYVNKYMRKHVLWYLKGEKDSKFLKTLVQQQSLDSVVEILKIHLGGGEK